MSTYICETNKAGTSGEADRLRRYISEMVSQIRSERRLRQIYTVARNLSINDRLEASNEHQD